MIGRYLPLEWLPGVTRCTHCAALLFDYPSETEKHTNWHLDQGEIDTRDTING